MVAHILDRLRRSGKLQNGACRCPSKWAHLRTRTKQLPAFGRDIDPCGTVEGQNGNDREERIHEIEDQALLERGGDRPCRIAVAATCAAACPASATRRDDR